MCADNDTALVKQAQNGVRDAFGLLVDKYKKPVYRFLYRLAGNHADADDLSQDAFMYAFESLDSFEAGTNFRAWLYTIARNRFLNFKKKRSRETMVSGNTAETIGSGSSSKKPDSPDTEEIFEAVKKAVDSLPMEQKQVVILHVMEGVPHSEIAEIMECNEKTVRWRLCYARKKLRKKLDDYTFLLE